MKRPAIHIEVVSDVVCPWCYIGKRRMERAVNQLKERYEFTISFSPFELNPDMPNEGVDQYKYLTKKFGGDERYQQITSHLTKIAAEEGLSFNFEKQKISPNTRSAHRIIWIASHEGKQSSVKEAFMKAYFEDGVDLSKKENLITVAVRAGLEKEKVEAFLESDEGLAEVLMAERMNNQRGVSGAPFYIINSKYAISGAQPSETFLKTLSEIGEKTS